MILDSDIIIDFLKNDKKTVNKISELKEKEELKTTTINIFELLKGFYALNKKEEKIIEFIEHLSILDFDFESSKKSAEIFDSLKKKGETVDALDLFISSIAITNKEKLYTGNTKHFKNIPGLEIL